MSKEITLEDYEQLKEEVKEAHAAASRAEGSLENLMSQLKEEFGCKSISQAKKLLAESATEVATLKDVFQKAQEAYIEKWKQDED